MSSSRLTTYSRRGKWYLAHVEDLATGVTVGVTGESYEQVRDCVQEELELVLAALAEEPLHEWCCPGCGATTRARMADH